VSSYPSPLEGKKQAAREEYLAAWTLKKSYDVAGNLGSLEVELGMFRDGAEHLSFAVRHYATTGTTAQQLEKAKQRLADAKKQVGAVTVTVSVDGAEVLVDGVSVGRAPLEGEIFVEPGARTIEARLNGYEGAKQAVQAEKGSAQSVALTLKALPVGTAPGAVTSAPVGGGAVTTPEAPKAPKEEAGVPPKVVMIAGGAAAGAALIAGVILTVVANGKAGDAEEQRRALVSSGGPGGCATRTSACDELLASVDAKDTFSSAAFWSFVGAGAIGAATGIYALVGLKEAEAPRAKAVPIMTSGGGGVLVRGSW
jgi:hypothetical protein